jgi:hypothetical protein
VAWLTGSQLRAGTIRRASPGCCGGRADLTVGYHRPRAPKGPFFMVLRQYRPKREALNGSWKLPHAVRVTQ